MNREKPLCFIGRHSHKFTIAIVSKIPEILEETKTKIIYKENLKLIDRDRVVIKSIIFEIKITLYLEKFFK